jgi:hypothetical protein
MSRTNLGPTESAIIIIIVIHHFCCNPGRIFRGWHTSFLNDVKLLPRNCNTIKRTLKSLILTFHNGNTTNSSKSKISYQKEKYLVTQITSLSCENVHLPSVSNIVTSHMSKWFTCNDLALNLHEKIYRNLLQVFLRNINKILATMKNIHKNQ